MAEKLTKEQHLSMANDLVVEVGEWLAGNGDIPGNDPQNAAIMVQLAQAHIALAALTPERKGWVPA